MIPAVKIKKLTQGYMNKIFSVFALIGIVAFQACEGPEGPIGPAGEPGLNIVGTAYESEVEFNAGNEFMEIFNFPEPLVESDAVLIYRLSEVNNGKDIWRLLPQTYFFNDGVLMYNFDYSVTDFSIFLDGEVNFAGLPSQWRTAQIFRIIVVPADFPAGRIDYSNYEGITDMLGLEDKDFLKL